MLFLLAAIVAAAIAFRGTLLVPPARAASLSDTATAFDIMLGWGDRVAGKGRAASLVPKIIVGHSAIVISLQHYPLPPCAARTLQQAWACRQRATFGSPVYEPTTSIAVIFPAQGGKWKCSSRARVAGNSYRLCAAVTVLGKYHYRITYERQRLTAAGPIKVRAKFDISSDRWSGLCNVKILEAARNYRDHLSVMVPHRDVWAEACH